MKYNLLLIVELFFSLIPAFLLFTRSVSAADVSVNIDSVGQVAEDQDFVARVKIDNVTNFDACNYDVTYNASILQAINVTSGLIDTTVIPVDMWKIISPGTVRVMQDVAGLAGVTGSGYLAEIHFHVIGSSGSSTISFNNGLLGDNTAQAITATWTGGSVEVIQSNAGTDNGGGGEEVLEEAGVPMGKLSPAFAAFHHPRVLSGRMFRR